MLWTAAQVRDKVRRDLDIDEDELVPDTQIYAFINDAVRDMVAEMIKLGVEDRYYLSNNADAPVSIVSAQEEYALPTDIYAQKIYRLIHARPGTREVYEVRRVRGRSEFLAYHEAKNFTYSNPVYKYMLLNKTAGVKLLLVPKPLVTEVDALTFWYVRQPIEVVGGSTNVDIPEEFISYILTFVKVECLKKDLGNPLMTDTMNELTRVRRLMIDTLTDQTADGDNQIEMDLSIYEEMG